MHRSIFSTALALSCVVLCPLTLPACGNGSPSEGAAVKAGTVSLPLTTVTNGSTYRLNATLFLSGPTFLSLATSQEPSETVLATRLPTGSYSAFLGSWSLEKADSTGGFLPVVASLVSSSAVSFSVFDETTTTLSYRFQTDGVTVVVGEGGLRVKVDVEETARACTPFQSDCPVGTWCPPAELLGAPSACIAAGVVALGESCASPTDCVAGASCFDLGAGPLCAALCPSSAFDEPCAVSGTCRAAGTDYGVCEP